MMVLPDGRRKKSRRLGPVDVMDRADYTAAALDTKVALIQRLIPLGLMHVQETLAAEVQELAGARHARKSNGETGCRYGRNPGSVRLGGQRLGIRVPRVRGDDGEIPLRSYRQLHTGSGEVVAPFGKVTVGPTGRVAGNVVASEITREPGGRIRGTREEIFTPFPTGSWGFPPVSAPNPP